MAMKNLSKLVTYVDRELYHRHQWKKLITVNSLSRTDIKNIFEISVVYGNKIYKNNVEN